MRILIITLVTLLYLPLQGQQIVDEMAQSTCDCMTKKGTEGKDAKGVEALMQECLIESLLPRLDDIQKELNVEITDQEGMRSVGEKIGMKMAVSCPNMMLAMVGGNILDAETSTSIKGEITKIEGKEFTKITIEDESGSTFKVLWLRSFEGDAQLIELGEKAIGKNVSVEFTEISCYSAKKQKYITQREIIGLVFQ